MEEPKGSLSLSNTIPCMIYAPKPPLPLLSSFTGHFWNSRAEPHSGLQELATGDIQLGLLIYRLKRRPPAQAGRRADRGRKQQRPGKALYLSARSLVVLRAITPEHPAIPKSINNLYAAQGTLPHLIKVSSHSYGFISP